MLRQYLPDAVKGLLLLVQIFNLSQLAELDERELLDGILVRPSLFDLFLKELCQGESRLVVEFNTVLLAHVVNIGVLDWRHNKTQTLATLGHPRRATDPVHVLLKLGAEVKVNDPSHSFKVQASRRHVSANQTAGRVFVEAKVRLLPVCVLHIAV